MVYIWSIKDLYNMKRLSSLFIAVFFIAVVLIVGGCDKPLGVHVEFDPNSAGGREMKAQKFRKGVPQALNLNTYSKEGCEFAGWNTIPDGSGISYADGQEISITSTITLYAQWSVNKYIVTFDANGGEGEMPPQEFEYFVEQRLNPNTFTRSGYTFYGWYTDWNDIVSDEGRFKVAMDVTLHARWFSEQGNGSVDGQYYVDLGLPSGTLWATRNVGASKVKDYGDYFAWGETATKASYTNENYLFHDNPLVLPAENDAAAANWGGAWRMPTSDDFKELTSEACIINRVWYMENGEYNSRVQGYMFTGKSNGNVLFLPMAGWYASCLNKAGENGEYWTSTIAMEDEEHVSDNKAKCFYFEDRSASVIKDSRSFGMPVRPVRSK